jgi:DNA-binding transcriptional LysR family regulator
MKVEPEMALESNDTYFVKLMIEHGLGVSLMPSWAVREEVKSGKLAQLGIAGHEFKRSVAMVSLKGARSSPIQAFIDDMIARKDKLQDLALD